MGTLFDAQTFTAGQSGLLTSVELDLEGQGSVIAALAVTNSAGVPSGFISGAIDATLNSASAYTWTPFVFDYPQPVIAGDVYEIVFISHSESAVSAAGSGDTYAAGQAMSFGHTGMAPVSADLDDFAFQTFVDPQKTSLAWSTSQLAPNTTESLTLTETIVFPPFLGVQPEQLGGEPNSPADVVWTVKSDSLPAWFTPTGIECAGQITTGDCTLANAAPGASMSITPDGNPIDITITLTGTASPSLADVGTATDKAEGCADYTAYGHSGDEVLSATSCVSGQAMVTVTAPAPTPTPPSSRTPPPTSTGHSPSSNGPSSTIWLLPLGIIGLLCAVGVILRLRPGSNG